MKARKVALDKALDKHKGLDFGDIGDGKEP